MDLILKSGHKHIIFGANYYSLPPSRGIIAWDKRQFMPTFSRWEYCWTDFEFPARIVEVNNSAEAKDYEHPTQKPLQLIIYLLNEFSEPGQLVCDPFNGSGTTAVACERTGRRWIGIEVSEKYCQIAKDRILKEANQIKLF